jgi:H+/Cl- antiporter ClcA
LVSSLWRKTVHFFGNLGNEEALGKLGDFTVGPRTLVISLLALVIGGLSALIALILLRLIGLITNLTFYGRWDFSLSSPAGNHLGFLMILVPVGGSLVVGLIARYGSERIRGHGIPEALESILMNGSRVEPKVAILKPIASAVAIGTGGPFGAEGPIIMTGGAFGSMIAQFFHLTAAERKTLLVAGAAGGMAAIFNTPIAATLLGVELMLFEWKPRSLIPVAVASVTATLVRSYLPGLGPNALFETPLHAPVWTIAPLAACLFVGFLGGILAILLTLAVYASEDMFHKLPIHWMWWPVIGGVGIGIGGLIYPPALGVGYDVIHQMLLGNMTMQMILGMLIVKGIIWAFSLSSGTSGGVLAPILLVGGALGGLESLFLPNVFPGFWPLISMTAALGATIGCPLTCIIFAIELTHDVTMFLPILLATMTAFIVVTLVMRRSILTEKISRRGYHLSREYATDPLEILFVREVMRTNVVAIDQRMKGSDLRRLLERTPSVPSSTTGHLVISPAQRHAQRLYPVLDEDKHLVGVASRHDLEKVLSNETNLNHNGYAINGQKGSEDDDPVYELTSVIHAQPVVAYPDEPLRSAVYRMAESGYTRLPVVQRDHPDQLVGVVSLQHLLQGRLHNLDEERHRERVLNLRLLFAPHPPAEKEQDPPQQEQAPSQPEEKQEAPKQKQKSSKH